MDGVYGHIPRSLAQGNIAGCLHGNQTGTGEVHHLITGHIPNTTKFTSDINIIALEVNAVAVRHQPFIRIDQKGG